jgi:hypothetical protein
MPTLRTTTPVSPRSRSAIGALLAVAIALEARIYDNVT